MTFVHCNVHTEFSLLDSTNRIKDLVKAAVDMDMPALAITDNGVMYGAFDFYKTAKDNGIKPLLGCEVYVSPKGRFDRTARRKGGGNHRLTLIAKNNKGYQNLLKLVSLSFTEGFYYKPRVDHEILEKYSEGLIAMSAGTLNGEIPQKILNGDMAGAKMMAEWYKERFDYYLELQNHGLPIQTKANQELYKLSKELEIPVVATNDAHYLTRDDATLHEILLCINDGKTLEDPSRFRYAGGPEYYLKTPKEMERLFREIPEALSNTLEIAEKCHVIIDTGSYILPVYDVPPGHNNETYLRELTWKGIRERYGEVTQEIRERVEFELKVIEDMGFPSYFLIVWDFINYARQKGIAVGPGRGSAAGSIVSYALRITNIEPLRYGLLFERFLNPDRISMPDVDIDFCVERREEVIQYVTRKYGSDKVAQILTVGAMKAKLVVRDVARTLGFEPTEADRLAKMIPGKPGTKLKDALGEDSDLTQEIKKSKNVKQLIDYALMLEGNARQVGVHAAGVVISRDPLDITVPLRSEEGKLITQFTKDEVEEVGLLKMDFLGLRNLTMISKTLEILEQSRGMILDMDTIPIDDLASYELLSSGHTIGVFQLESSGMQKLVRSMKPSTLEDIIALVALYRPGPLGSGMDKTYVKRKFGEEEVSYYHDSLTSFLEPILKETYGLILYQEQIMQVSRALGGFTPGEADALRKAMGKKKADVMAKMKAKFVDGAEKNGIARDVSGELFGIMEEFAKYGFNKSHSAAYGYVAYQTAYLKANYPVEYMAALISSVMSTQDKVPIYVGESRRMNIKILPPDINESHNIFRVKKDKILFGLGAVKNLGESAIENIIAEREENGPFTSIFDFCTRVNLTVVNKRAVESLIKVGAFSNLHPNRKQLVETLDDLMSSATRIQKNKDKGQISLFELEAAEDMAFEQAPPLKEVEEYPWQEMLEEEKQVLGIYASGHPLTPIENQVNAYALHQVLDLPTLDDGRETTLAGMMMDKTVRLTRKNKEMMIIKFEDLSGAIEIFVFPRTFEKYKEVLMANDIVLIRGKVRSNEENPLQVMLEDVRPLSQLSALKLTFPTFKIPQLTALKEVLAKFPGETPVMLLSQTDPQHMIVTGCDFWVSPEERLMEHLKKHLGQNNVYIDAA